jgi:hypothetical protein
LGDGNNRDTVRTVAAGEARMLGWHAVPTLPRDRANPTRGKGNPYPIQVDVRRSANRCDAVASLPEEAEPDTLISSRQLGQHAVLPLPDTSANPTLRQAGGVALRGKLRSLEGCSVSSN